MPDPPEDGLPFFFGKDSPPTNQPLLQLQIGSDRCVLRGTKIPPNLHVDETPKIIHFSCNSELKIHNVLNKISIQNDKKLTPPLAKRPTESTKETGQVRENRGRYMGPFTKIVKWKNTKCTIPDTLHVSNLVRSSDNIPFLSPKFDNPFFVEHTGQRHQPKYGCMKIDENRVHGQAQN